MSTTTRVLAALALGLVAVAGCTGEVWVEDGEPRIAHDSGVSDAPWVALPDAVSVTDDAHVARPDAVVPPPPDAWTAPIVGCDDPVEQQVIALVNASRTSMGLGAVRCDPAMTAVARGHSSDMCSRDYFDHTGLDGRDPFDRLRDGGVRFSSASENIAQGQGDPDEVHTAWMNSAGHRRNILDGDYGRIGVGFDRCGGQRYWTQVFAD